MITTTNNRADKYNHQSSWKKLYLNTKKRKTDLLLYRHDLQFIQLVLNRYFQTESNVENIEITSDKGISLVHLHRYCDTLIAETNNHLRQLANLIKEPFDYSYTKFKKENNYLKADIANFVKTLRRVRTDIFEITEAVLKNEFFLSNAEINSTPLKST